MKQFSEKTTKLSRDKVNENVSNLNFSGRKMSTPAEMLAERSFVSRTKKKSQSFDVFGKTIEMKFLEKPQKNSSFSFDTNDKVLDRKTQILIEFLMPYLFAVQSFLTSELSF